MTTRGIRARGRGGPGLGQWIGLCLAGGVILGLTFTLGVLVGRQWARPAPPATAGETERKPVAPSRRGGVAAPEPGGGSPAQQVQDKLTFYDTLTAPLPPAAPAARPKPEDRSRPVTASPAASGPEPEAAGGSARETRSTWSVQVAALKSRSQADGIKKQLVEAGYSAYVTAVSAQDGQMRYRVRVGTFKTRDEALRVAERVRSERSLPTLVTPD
jgi:cell division septation protein DedD